MPWLGHHDMGTPFTGDVFGGWDQRVINETKGKGAAFEMRKSVTGFIRQNTNKQTGPPVIMVMKIYLQ